MAQRAKSGSPRTLFPGARTFGSATVTARNQLSWLWSRESMLRLALSLVLALALWLYVTGKQDPGYVDFAPPLQVTVSEMARGVIATGGLGSVHVRYQTNNPNLYVTPANFHVTVSLLNKGPGKWPHVPVTVVADPGITVVKVTPSHIAVVIERVLQRRVPVIPRILANAPLGYNASAPQISPSTVQVSGAKSVVSQVSRATVDLNLSAQRSGLLASFPVLLEDSQGLSVIGSSHILVSPSQVQVQVPIKQLASFKTVPLLVPIKGHPVQGLGVAGINVQPAAITVTGSPSVLSRLSTVSTAPVSTTGRRSGQFKTKIAIRLPHGVVSTTRTASIVVQLRPVDASSSVEIGVSPRNVAAGLTGHVRPGVVLVTLIGSSATLSKAAHRITATVDLTNYGIGSYTVQPNIKAPPGIQIGDIYPQTVTATVSPATSSR